jgi:hypothetical protein
MGANDRESKYRRDLQKKTTARTLILITSLSPCLCHMEMHCFIQEYEKVYAWTNNRLPTTHPWGWSNESVWTKEDKCKQHSQDGVSR